MDWKWYKEECKYAWGGGRKTQSSTQGGEGGPSIWNFEVIIQTLCVSNVKMLSFYVIWFKIQTLSKSTKDI